MKLLSFIIILFSLSVSAQVDDFRTAYDSFKNQTKKEYNDFRDKANKEYADFVRKAWKDYEVLPVVPMPKDEPVVPVVIKDEEREVPVEDRPVVIEEEIVVPEPLPQPTPVAPIKEVPVTPIEDDADKVETLGFSLYGTAMEVRAGGKQKFSLRDVSGESLAEAWERLSSDDYNNLIRDCLELRIRHRLCDWSYLRMLDKVCGELLGRGTNEAELLKAFIYCQSGYQMRLAIESGRLHMLYASQYYIFDKPCWVIDGVYFFSDDVKADKISICGATFPHEQAMSLAITEEQMLARKAGKERTLQSDDVSWMKATVTEDENLMVFFNDYPASYFGEDFMTRWAINANVPICRQVKERLYPQLKAWIAGKSKAEAVDMICHWIQTAFVYEYDDKVWGGDRAFFPDETLYYPYCDCEDRSILLTRIVRDLLGLKCALVYYPGHLATAIALGEETKGDYIRIGGTKYIVCDPTYIGAPIGVTMPDMDNKTAKVIVLN